MREEEWGRGGERAKEVRLRGQMVLKTKGRQGEIWVYR